jgi:hypothetical protein
MELPNPLEMSNQHATLIHIPVPDDVARRLLALPLICRATVVANALQFISAARKPDSTSD